MSVGLAGKVMKVRDRSKMGIPGISGWRHKRKQLLVIDLLRAILSMKFMLENPKVNPHQYKSTREYEVERNTAIKCCQALGLDHHLVEVELDTLIAKLMGVSHAMIPVNQIILPGSVEYESVVNS